MNIVIPMAGRGSRFAEVGYDLPKPLIDVRGRPMYSWATESLPLAFAKRLIFICLREHLQSLALEQDITSRYAAYRPLIIPLDEVTEGQLCTVLTAQEYINTSEPLLIFNADTYCPTTIADALSLWGPRVDGALDVFEAEGDRWSFARLIDGDRVVETAEKCRISPWATTGLYYFARGDEFVKHAQQMISDNDRVNNEFYIAPLYNRLIAAGADIRANKVERTWVLGTPEDLARFEREYPQ